jgi:DNA-binding SARP family transcriptional activator
MAVCVQGVLVRFEVLGMLRVVDAGVEVAVKGRTQRRVLAALLARVDGQISLAELVDALWPESPPGNAVKNVQSYMAKLRNVLGDPGIIGSGPGGYWLAGGRFDLDAREFSDAVRRAQQAQLGDDVRTASSMLDGAFGLWRGRPYADLQDWRFLHPEVERLEQTWLEALGIGVELGMHGRMLPQLTALVEESPYREGAVALLMRVLHAVGRQAEAVELYWSTKRRLAEELGIDPTPALQDLYQALLQGEPARTSVSSPSRSESNRDPGVHHSDSEPALSIATSRSSTVSRPRFVLLDGMPRPPKAYQERIDHLQSLTRFGNESQPAIVCSLTGARGVGKTQLAASYARLRLAQGWSVAWIDSESRERLTAGLADLADELGLRSPTEDTEYTAMKARRWLSECRTPALLVLDNAVDPDLIRQWQPTAGSVQIVVTSNRRVFGWLGEDVEVGVFTTPQARTFLRECTGLVDDATDQLIEAVGGHPLALALAAAVITRERLSCQEYLRRLSALPLDAALAPHDGDPYPRGIGEAIRLSLAAAEQQKPQAGDLAELVAVLSPAGVTRSLLVPDDVREDVRAELSGILGLLADISLIGYSQDGHAVIAPAL